MKALLIFLIILSFGGAGSSLKLIYANDPSVFPKLVAGVIFYIIGSLISSFYLYKKVEDFKGEWFLFGFLASFNAVIVYCLWKSCSDRWRKKRSVFTP